MEHHIKDPAGLWVRVLASIVDAIVIGLPLALLGYLVFGTTDNYYVNILSFLYYLLIPVVWYGYTVGKRVVGIRILKVNGQNVGIGTMFLRLVIGSLVHVVTLGITLIASLVLIIVRKDKRTVHDLIAGTYVTYDKTILE